MHRHAIVLILIIVPAIYAVESPASILDLLSWDLEDGSEAEKRDESSSTAAQRSCACNGPSCMCCVDFNITYIDLGGPGCVHMKYISPEEGIAVNVSYGDSLLHSEQVKGPDPEPTCMSLLANLAQVCARFSNLHPVENGLEGCLQLEPKLLGQVQAHFDIGCFTMGPDGMKLLDPTSNSTVTPAPTVIVESKNETQTEPEELNEEELIAAVNETAEQGLVFFGNWLGLFGKPDVNATNSEAGSETNSATESSSVSTETSRKARVLPPTTLNQL